MGWLFGKKENEYVRYLLDTAYWLKEVAENEICKWEAKGGEALERQKTYWSGNYNSLLDYMNYIDNDIKILEKNLYNKTIEPEEFKEDLFRKSNILLKHEHDTKFGEDGFLKLPGARAWMFIMNDLYHYCKNHNVDEQILEYYKLDHMVPVNLGLYGKWDWQQLWLLKVASVELGHHIYEAKRVNSEFGGLPDKLGATYRQRLLDSLHEEALIENTAMIVRGVMTDCKLNKTNYNSVVHILSRSENFDVAVEMQFDGKKHNVLIGNEVVNGYVKEATALTLKQEVENIISKLN